MKYYKMFSKNIILWTIKI